MFWKNKDKATEMDKSDARNWRAYREKENKRLMKTRARAVFHIEMVDGDMFSFEVDVDPLKYGDDFGGFVAGAEYRIKSLFAHMQTSKHGITHDNTFIPLHMIKTITMDDIEEYTV